MYLFVAIKTVNTSVFSTNVLYPHQIQFFFYSCSLELLVENDLRIMSQRFI